MFDILITFDVACGCLAIYFFLKLFLSKSSRPKYSLPPGPKPLPLIGNLLDMPKGPEGPHWAKHKALYGPISSVSVLGTTIVILNDANITYELLEKRSSIYSSRPSTVFGGEIVGLGPSTPLLPYGDAFQSHRKRLHNCIGTRAAMERFELLEEIEVRRLLLRLLNEPAEYAKHVRTVSGAIILKIAYGYTIEPNDPDPLVDIANETLDIFSKAFVPGKWLVDVLPFLRYFPEWLPGMGFQKNAREWNAIVLKAINWPYAFVRHQMAAGKALPSFTLDNIELGIADDKDEEILKWTAGSLYGGGADTTVSALHTFVLAMTLNPSILKCAQEEIDRVIGLDRLPTLADRQNLPFIDALLKETLRWQNVVPTGVAHLTTEADVYMNYYIPKNAVVISNIWQMTHDPEHYHDPFVFKPERFLDGNDHTPEPDSRPLAFGFGRRVCPGKRIADTSLFISIAMIVAVFNISKAKDSTGRDIEPEIQYSAGVISHPTPFACNILPRSQKAIALIESVLDEYPFEVSDAEILKKL